jgi:hypothetical protein
MCAFQICRNATVEAQYRRLMENEKIMRKVVIDLLRDHDGSVPPAPVAAPDIDDSVLPDDPQSALTLFCQAWVKQPPRFDESDSDGPLFSPFGAQVSLPFVVQGLVEESSFTAFAGNKKTARREASRAACKFLLKAGIMDPKDYRPTPAAQKLLQDATKSAQAAASSSFVVGSASPSLRSAQIQISASDLPTYDVHSKLSAGKNAVSELKEYADRLRLGQPTYVDSQSGPSHSPNFTSTVNFHGLQVTANGPTKAKAKEEAALRWLMTYAHSPAQNSALFF